MTTYVVTGNMTYSLPKTPDDFLIHVDNMDVQDAGWIYFTVPYTLCTLYILL